MREALPSASLQPSSSISIIVLRAVHASLGLSFGFKGWTYATTAVMLVHEHLSQSFDSNSMAYFDTACEITLIDRDWLLNHLSDQKIKTISTPLKVGNIGASKHNFSKFAALSLNFLYRNNVRDLVYVSLQSEIHLVESLWANLLIDNKIMSFKTIVINLGRKAHL